MKSKKYTKVQKFLKRKLVLIKYEEGTLTRKDVQTHIFKLYRRINVKNKVAYIRCWQEKLNKIKVTLHELFPDAAADLIFTFIRYIPADKENDHKDQKNAQIKILQDIFESKI
jgi:hypothetical protein